MLRINDLKEIELNKKKGLLKMLMRQNAANNIRLAASLGSNSLLLDAKKNYKEFYEKNPFKNSNFSHKSLVNFALLDGVNPDNYKDLQREWQRTEQYRGRRLTKEEVEALRDRYIEKEPSERTKLALLRSDLKLKNDFGKEAFRTGREFLKSTW